MLVQHYLYSLQRLQKNMINKLLYSIIEGESIKVNEKSIVWSNCFSFRN